MGTSPRVGDDMAREAASKKARLRTLLDANKRADQRLVRDSLDLIRQVRDSGGPGRTTPRGQVSPYARRQVCKEDHPPMRPVLTRRSSG